VVRLDPNWSVEKYLSDGGGYPDDAATLFVDAARKAGVTACVPPDKLSSIPNLIDVKFLATLFLLPKQPSRSG
jgi:transglutaminase-like putative cysteine protease